VYFILFLCNAIENVILARYFFTSLYWQFREGPSRTYGWVAFVSANIIAEFPAAILVTVVYFLLWYFPSGLPHSQAGYIFLFLLTYEIFQVSSVSQIPKFAVFKCPASGFTWSLHDGP